MPRLPRFIDLADAPPDYAQLATLKAAGMLAGLVAAATLLLWRVPVTHYPMWLVYLSGAAALIWVDLKTMWLPKRLHWIVTAQLGLAVAISASFEPALALRAVLGALGAFTLLWLVWRFSMNFGFGDVRFGLLLGAVSGASGAQHVFTALFAGTLVGACWAICHRLFKGTGPFPYGPSLWLGPLLAAALVG